MSARPQLKARGAELIIPLLGIALTVYYFISISGLPWTAKVATYFIGSVLLALSTVTIARIVLQLRNRRATLAFTQLTDPAHYLPKRIGLVIMTVAYVALLDWGGFMLTTFVFLFLSMWLLGGSAVVRMALLLAFIYALGGYLLFVVAFKTRFPSGPFESLLQAVF